MVVVNTVFERFHWDLLLGRHDVGEICMIIPNLKQIAIPRDTMARVSVILPGQRMSAVPAARQI